MRNIIFYTALLLGLITTAKTSAQSNITTSDEGIEIPETMIWDIDSLLTDWQVKKYLNLNKDCETSPHNPFFTDSIYAQRLSRIPSLMDMPYNENIRKYIDLYAEKLRTQVSLMLAASNFYMPIFEEALDAYNLPIELKYLPIIESALNPKATSRAGAAGLWQFMLTTSKHYGLETNSLVDERRDPIKATWAAARYLKDLYDIYKDWNLVIAAYNCGPGNINKAIRRAGGETSYWTISEYLPKETRAYVPLFIAANYIMTYYCDHNICPIDVTLPALTDTIKVNKEIHFEQIANVCQIDKEELMSLNPQFKTDVIPGDSKPYDVRLPVNAIPSFIENLDLIYNYKRDELFRKEPVVVSIPQTKTKAKPKAKPSSSTTHKIQSGESLSSIARKYGVSVAKLKEWNGLTNDNIRAGKSLKIMK